MKSQGTNPFQQIYRWVGHRRGKKIAGVTLGRKLLTTAYVILKSDQPYDPRKLTQAPE
jgi:hypothetical protein